MRHLRTDHQRTCRSQPPNVEVGPLSLRFVIKGQGDTHPACFWTELASVADKQGGGWVKEDAHAAE